ncbi:MAG: pentapeptide repeat-containing protein [Thermomicrobiales bacterium]
MDRDRFDALARLLAASGSRRRALGAALGVLLLGRSPQTLARRHHRRARGNGKSRHHEDGNHERHHAGSEPEATSRSVSRNDETGAQRSSAGRTGDTAPQQASVERTGRRGKAKRQGKKPQAQCFDGGPCLPAPRANLQRCDFSGSNTLANVDCTQCNLQGATLRRANAANANFSNANLGRTCLVEADLRGATITGGTNLRGAIRCRTTMPDGSIDNSGCASGTACCPTCIGIGETCGGDAGGSCCGGAVCQNGRCTCPADRPATCDGVCRECCARSDCPAQECRTADCIGQGTCKYSVVPDNRSGPLCPAPQVCCDGGCCASDQVCDTRGDGAICCTPESAEETCHPAGRQPRCGRTPNNCGDPVDCGRCEDVVCNTGTCRNRLHICQYTPVDDLTRCSAESIADGICCDGRCAAGNCCGNANCNGSSNTCTDNTCRCGSGVACTFPNTTCCGASPEGTCVDTERDTNNCGRCGNRCARNRVCGDDPARCCQPPGIFCSYLFGLQRNCCSRSCKPFPFAPIGIGTCH